MTDEIKPRVDLTHWKKNPDGSINFQPVIDWECAPFTIAGILRLRFASERDRPDHQQTLQFAMSAVQLIALAQDLARMGSTLMATPKPGTPSH